MTNRCHSRERGSEMNDGFAVKNGVLKKYRGEEKK